MGVDGWQSLTITGPASDLDELEFFFKISYEQEDRTQTQKEFGELWDLHSKCMIMCSTNPMKMVGWFGNQSEEYTRLLETDGGKLFKQLIDQPWIKSFNIDAMYELKKHTLLFSSMRRESPNELIVWHNFLRRSTISYVECLAGFFPMCMFENYCKIENGYAEIQIFGSKRVCWDLSWSCCWDTYPDWCAVPSCEKYGISSKEAIKESQCGCLSLGLPSCFMMDPSRSYAVTLYADFSTWYPSINGVIGNAETIEQQFADLRTWLTMKGIELMGPDGKPYSYTDEWESLEQYRHQKEIQDIIFGYENPKTQFSAVSFKCTLVGKNPKDLLVLFLKKYNAAYWWCEYEDIDKQIKGTIEKDVSYHYPIRVNANPL